MADPAIERLLRSRDPSIRYLTRTEVLGESPRSRALREERERIPRGPWVRALLRGQRRDGGFGVSAYSKWTGAHWRLVSLVELAIPRDHQRARAAAEQVLAWLGSKQHRSTIRTVSGLVRQHASMEGNALAVCCRLGLARDARVRALVDSLLAAQWPDGGWNCDPRPEARHSSFYETITPLWGLAEYGRATGDEEAAAAAARAAEPFLRRRLFRSARSGEVANPRWLELHYPLYWHYDVLHGLVILSRAGKLGDSRTVEALDLVEIKRREDGLWWPEAYYWRMQDSRGGNLEAVDWGRGRPSEPITLNALRVLAAAGRL